MASSKPSSSSHSTQTPASATSHNSETPTPAAVQRLVAMFQREGLRITGCVTQAGAQFAERGQWGEMTSYNNLTHELEGLMRDFGIGTGMGTVPTVKSAAAGGR